MKQSSKRFASMILALLFLAGSLVVYFDLVQPTYGDLQTKKGTQLSTQSFIANEQDVVNQAKKLIAQYDSSSQAADSLALAMPSGPNVASALAQIYGIAQQNGLTVKNVAITPPTAQAAPSGSGQANGGSVQILKPMGTINFQVSAQGTYEGVKGFLSQLETNIRVFDVTGVSVQGASGAVVGKQLPGQDQFSYTFTIATYYQIP